MICIHPRQPSMKSTIGVKCGDEAQPDFSLERHLVDRQTYKKRRSVALAQWQLVARAPGSETKPHAVESGSL